MGLLVLLAGVMLLLLGVSSLTAGDMAAHGRGRRHRRSYGVALTAAGALAAVGGLVWVVAA